MSKNDVIIKTGLRTAFGTGVSLDFLSRCSRGNSRGLHFGKFIIVLSLCQVRVLALFSRLFIGAHTILEKLVAVEWGTPGRAGGARLSRRRLALTASFSRSPGSREGPWPFGSLKISL